MCVKRLFWGWLVHVVRCILHLKSTSAALHTAGDTGRALLICGIQVSHLSFCLFLHVFTLLHPSAGSGSARLSDCDTILMYFIRAAAEKTEDVLHAFSDFCSLECEI